MARQGTGGEAVQRGHGQLIAKELWRLISSVHAHSLDLLTHCCEQVDKVGRRLLEKKVLE